MIHYNKNKHHALNNPCSVINIKKKCIVRSKYRPEHLAHRVQ